MTRDDRPDPPDGGPAQGGRSDRPAWLGDLDLAILVAFTRPFAKGQRFASPAPNAKILDELAAQQQPIDADTLRTHLRNLYARFGVEDGLTPAEKRVRLVELVYERRVIPGWGAKKPPDVPDPPPKVPPETPDDDEPQTTSTTETTDTTGDPERTARRPGRRRLAAAAVAAAILALAAWAIVAALDDQAPSGPATQADGVKVIDLASLRHAQGRVNYCTGKDVAKSRDGKTRQHRKAVDAFNERFGPGLHANLIQFPEQAALQYEKFSSYQRRGLSTCDVFYSDVIWTADFAHKKWLYDLTPYVRPRLGSFVPGMRDAARFENRLWAVPKQADAALLYYNTDTVKQAPATWQELYELAATGKQNRFRTQGLASEALTVVFLEIAYAAGADDVITPDHKANIDQTAALDALQLMVNGIKQKAVPPNIVNQVEETSIRAFGRGRADLMRNWPYAYALLDDHAAYPKVAGHVAVAPLPTWDSGPPVSVLGGHLLVISAFTKNPGAALKLVDFLSSAGIIRQDATDFSLAPALASLYRDPKVQQALPAIGDLEDAIFAARSRPVTPNYQEISDAISTNVNRALQGSLSPREALASANDAMQQALDEVYDTP